MNSIGNRCVVLSTATRLKAKTVFLTALTVAALGAGGSAQSAGPVTVASNDAKAAPAVAGSAAAGSGAAAAAPAAPPSIITAADVQALKDALAAQQLEIERLSQQLDRQQAQQAAAQAAAAQAAAQPAQAKQVAELGTAVGPQQDTVPSNGLNLQDTGPRSTNPMESDISIHFRGITITSGGFAEAAFVRRSRALGADITTPFNSLTMPGASQSQLSEFFGSARQSRPTVYVDGRLKNVEFSRRPSTYTVGRDCRAEPKNSDSWLCEAPGMVSELKGVVRSAARALDRRTNAASANPPGVIVIPLKCIDTVPCMGFVSGWAGVSCRLRLW